MAEVNCPVFRELDELKRNLQKQEINRAHMCIQLLRKLQKFLSEEFGNDIFKTLASFICIKFDYSSYNGVHIQSKYCFMRFCDLKYRFSFDLRDDGYTFHNSSHMLHYDAHTFEELCEFIHTRFDLTRSSNIKPAKQ